MSTMTICVKNRYTFVEKGIDNNGNNRKRDDVSTDQFNIFLQHKSDNYTRPTTIK